MGKLRKVRQPDGRIVPFSETRVVRSIELAVKAAGGEDGVLAEELAGVVALFLERAFDDERPPRTADIRDMIRKVLLETGHVDVAEAYCSIASPPVPSDDGGPLQSVEVVRGIFGDVEAFDRGVLAADLVLRHGLDEKDADEVAATVLAHVQALDWRRVRGRLLREMADAELQSRGLDGVLASESHVSVPKSDVESWLFTMATSDPAASATATVVEPWALTDVYDGLAARAHQAGDLHILGAGEPHRVERVYVDATGPAFRMIRDADGLLRRVLMLARALNPLVRRRLFIRRFGDAVNGLKNRPTRTRIRRMVESLVEHLLERDVFGRPLLAEMTLEVDIAPPQADADVAHWLAEALLSAISQRRKLSGRLGLLFVLDVAAGAMVPDTTFLDRMVAAVRQQPGVAMEILRTRDASLERQQRKSEGVFLDVGAVALNLPLIFAKAGARDAADLPAALAEPLRAAILALETKYWFLRRAAPQTLRGVIEHMPGGEILAVDGAGQGAEVLVWGLPYMLELCGAGAEPARAAGILSHLFSYIDFVLGENAGPAGLKLGLGGLVDRPVRERFLAAALRHAVHDADGPEVLDALQRTRVSAPALPLPAPLLDPVNGAFLKGRFLRRLAGGLPLPTRGQDEVIGTAWLRRLMTSTELAYFELEERREVIETQNELF